MRARAPLLPVVLALLAPGAAGRLAAQSPSLATIRGVVMDSAAGRPLAGATVMTVRGAHFAGSDALGRFTFDSLPPGSYELDVAHPALDSLGFAVAPMRVDVGAGQEAQVVLGVPSAATLLARLCAGRLTEPDLVGMVHGIVRDAVTDAPLPGARVMVRWAQIAVAHGNPARTVERVEQTADARGAFAVCGVPVNTAITLAGDTATASVGEIESVVPARTRVARLTLLLPPSAAAAPAGAAPRASPGAVVSGRVVDGAGHPVAGALVAIGAHPEVRADQQGEFRVAGLTPGSQMAEVRAIGRSPTRVPVHVRGGENAPVRLVTGERATMLDVVEVTAEMADPTGFAHRRESGMGRYVDRSAIERRGPEHISEMLRDFPGVLLVGPELDQVRLAGMRGQVCVPSFVVDGASTGGGLAVEIPPEEIESVELYRGTTAPMEFYQFNDRYGCGSVIVWTRRGTQRALERAARARDRAHAAREEERAATLEGARAHP